MLWVLRYPATTDTIFVKIQRADVGLKHMTFHVNTDSVHKILYIDNDFEKLLCASKHLSDQIVQSFGFTKFRTLLN